MPATGSTPRITGALTPHPRGFGFLTLERDVDSSLPESAFVPPREMRSFLSGDRVRALLVLEDDGRFSVRDLKLVERWRTLLCGAPTRRNRTLLLRLDARVGAGDWPLDQAPENLAEDALVVARIEGQRAIFLREIPPNRAGRERVLINWGLERSFPEDAQQAAASVSVSSTDRRDLRDLPTLTIDAAHSRDLDDALSALPAQTDGAIRVLVSIADVDAAVSAGSVLDREARARCTSVYLSDGVLPMLPRSLSEGLLSLNPEVERATMTVELRIDPEGSVTAVDLYPSLIRSDARLTYDGAAAFLDRGDVAAVPEVVRPTLRWLRAAAARLARVRRGRGGVTFVREEVRLILDDLGEPVELRPSALNCAHMLVERLMVAANEAVASWLAARGLPGLYRVQDEPVPDQVQALSEFSHNFGLEAGFGERLTPRALGAFEDQYTGTVVAPAVRTVVRRVLGRARYTTEPLPHFGLAAPLYLHFTSPIRRYADLAVHRIVKRHLQGERDQIAHDPGLVDLGETINERSARAAKAELERRSSLIARLFSSRIGEPCVGRVIRVQPFGLVVQLAGLGITGTVAAEQLAGGPFRHDPATESLTGKARQYQVGDQLDLEVRSTDERLGRLELTPRPGGA